MRIDLEHADAGVRLADGLDGAVADRVFSAERGGHLARVEGLLGGRVDVRVHGFARGVDPGDRLGVRGGGPASVDDGLGEAAGLRGQLDQVRGRGVHEDAAFVDGAEAAVEQVELDGGGADAVGGVDGARAVARGGVEGRGDDDDAGVGPGGGQAEDGVARHERGVRVEGGWVGGGWVWLALAHAGFSVVGSRRMLRA